MKQFFKESLVPINAAGLHQVRITEILYQICINSFKVKVNDQRLCGINTIMARSTGLVVDIFQLPDWLHY